MADIEEARKAMIAKRFGGNTKGAATGGSGTQRRKSKAVHKTGGGKIKKNLIFDDYDNDFFLYCNIINFYYYNYIFIVYYV